ncbi:hypothetical protein PLICRDRAFT_43924 [Plicaturopsis crispa FD-325 SS-3]|nr:hypothetical protein PLICRDRAFT_43924 [Plicaturopsis crispa FD-325 SS-3]
MFGGRTEGVGLLINRPLGCVWHSLYAAGRVLRVGRTSRGGSGAFFLYFESCIARRGCLGSGAVTICGEADASSSALSPQSRRRRCMCIPDAFRGDPG